MTLFLNIQTLKAGNSYLSILRRNNNFLTLLTKYCFVFLTRFRGAWNNNSRYINSRFHLTRVAKRVGIYSKFNYCFSHSGSYSAVLLSADQKIIGLDIEKKERKLSKSLSIKIRNLFPNLYLSELKIIMILETLVKIKLNSKQFTFQRLFSEIDVVKISPITNNFYEINVNDTKVYSKIFTLEDLHICITLESQKFGLSL